MRGLTLPTPRDPRNAKEVGLKVRDSFCMCVQEVGRSTVRRLRGVLPLRAGRLLTSLAATSRSAPYTKRDATRDGCSRTDCTTSCAAIQ